MSLSEEEKRILTQIERGLSSEDPEFVKEVDANSVYRHMFRSLRLPIFGIVAGFILMVGLLLVHWMLSLVGFVVACYFAVKLERSVRLIGKTGISDLNDAVRSRSSL